MGEPYCVGQIINVLSVTPSLKAPMICIVGAIGSASLEHCNLLVVGFRTSLSIADKRRIKARSCGTSCLLWILAVVLPWGNTGLTSFCYRIIKIISRRALNVLTVSVKGTRYSSWTCKLSSGTKTIVICVSRHSIKWFDNCASCGAPGSLVANSASFCIWWCCRPCSWNAISRRQINLRARSSW